MLCALADAPAAARHRDHNSENRKRSVIAYARAGSGRANVQMGWERIPFELVAAAGGGGGGSEPVGALISSAPPPARRKAEAALSAAALLCSDMSQKHLVHSQCHVFASPNELHVPGSRVPKLSVGPHRWSSNTKLHWLRPRKQRRVTGDSVAHIWLRAQEAHRHLLPLL